MINGAFFTMSGLESRQFHVVAVSVNDERDHTRKFLFVSQLTLVTTGGGVEWPASEYLLQATWIFASQRPFSVECAPHPMGVIKN